MVKYLDKERFNGNKPLLLYPNSYYPDKLILKYNKFEMPKEFDLFDAMRCKKIDLGKKKIVFGIKVREEDLIKYDFLCCNDGGCDFIVNNRVLEKMNQLCPKDFQALPIIIKSLNPDSEEKFENKDFWLINILQKKQIFDKKCIYYINRIPKMNRKIVVDGSMGDALLAKDKILSSSTFFHPSLAKHFIKSKGVQFLTDEEASLGSTEVGISEWEKERYEGRWSLLPD